MTLHTFAPARKTLLIGLMLLPVVAFAKLGDTRAQTEKNWHKPTKVDAEMNSATYVKGKFTLVEHYNQDGKAIDSVYMKDGDITKEEFATLSEGNVKGLKPTNGKKIYNPQLAQLKKVKTEGSSTYLFKDRKSGSEYIVQQSWPKGFYIVGFYISESPTFADIKQDIDDQKLTP